MPTYKIPEPRFVLKDARNPRVETLIYMMIHWTDTHGHGRRLKLSTGKQVRPEHWDKKQMVVKAITSTLPFRDEINNRISEYRAAAIDVWKVIGRDATPDQYRKRFFRYLEEQVSEIARQAAKMDFAEFLDHFVLEVNKGNVNKKKCYQLLMKYRTQTGAPFSFYAIDEQWARQFKQWLLTDQRNHPALSKNYVARILKTFRGILQKAYDKGLHSNLEFKEDSFRESGEESVKVALSPLEVEHFFHFDFGTDTRLAKARNIFLASTLTGLRWSDIIRLESRHISSASEGFIVSIANHKTGKVTTSPADPRLSEILERLGGKVPSISNQKLNDYVKEATRAAGLARPILVSRKPEAWAPLYEVITFHDSRVSYATELYRQGFSVDEIREFMGHSKIGTTQGYVLKDDVDAVERVNRAMAARKRREDEEGNLRLIK